MRLTVTPAYGRDYKSAKAALDDWNANRDFIIQAAFHRYNGKPINKEQADEAGEQITIRYNNLRRVVNTEGAR